MNAHVCLVEDDAALQDILRSYLEREGYRVSSWINGKTALSAIVANAPDIVILDIMLPGLDGMTIVQRLRSMGLSIPVILLTARTTENDRLAGFMAGADDYVVKPFSPAEVVMRVQAVLRRANPTLGTAKCSWGPVVLDGSAHTVSVEGQDVWLTPSEFRLLATLMKRPGQTFSRQQLLDAIAGDDFDGFDRNVDVHIARLRRKLALPPPGIQTVYGIGYRLPEVGS